MVLTAVNWETGCVTCTSGLVCKSLADLVRAMTAPSHHPGTAEYAVRSVLSPLNLREPAEETTALPLTNQEDPGLLKGSRRGVWANFLSSNPAFNS